MGVPIKSLFTLFVGLLIAVTVSSSNAQEEDGKPFSFDDSWNEEN